MTARERADKLVEHIKRNPHKWIHEFSLDIEQAINAAVEEDRKARPHLFVGRLDRYCEVCNEPDRDKRHIWEIVIHPTASDR